MTFTKSPQQKKNLIIVCEHILFACLSYGFCFQLFSKTVGNEKPQRRGSVGSLDSGMSISYTSASTGSRDNAKVRLMQQPFQVRFEKE